MIQGHSIFIQSAFNEWGASDSTANWWSYKQIIALLQKLVSIVQAIQSGSRESPTRKNANCVNPIEKLAEIINGKVDVESPVQEFKIIRAAVDKDLAQLLPQNIQCFNRDVSASATHCLEDHH